MSMNSLRATRAFSVRRANAMKDFSCADDAHEEYLDSLEDEYVVADKVTKALRTPRFGGRFVSVKGLAALVNSAKIEFEASKEGGMLPWNLDLLTSTGFSHKLNSRNGRNTLKAEADDMIIRYARFGGWLRTIATGECDATRRMFKKTQGGGMGSNATKFSLWDMQKRWPSPHKLECMVRAVRDRGNAILTAYTGRPRVSNKGIALGLMAERSVGKAAVVAVAITFGLFNRWHGTKYREARAALIDLHLNHPVIQKDDGISSRIGREPMLVDGNIAVYAAKFSGEGKVSLNKGGWLVVSGVRSFHVEWEQGYTYYDEIEQRSSHLTLYKRQVAMKEAVREAREGWERQDRIARENERYRLEAEAQAKADEVRHAELIKFLTGEEMGSCPLIYREDSFEAGNCRPGTEEWLLQRGWRGKVFIPGRLLIPHIGDSRVERVVYAAMARRKELSVAA